MGRSRASAHAEAVHVRKLFGSRRTVRFAGLILAGVLVASAVPGADAVSAERLTSAQRAAQWLVGQQQPNGAFFSETQRVDQTAETLGAIVAGGITGAPVTSALGYIGANGQAGATRAGLTGRIVAGIVAAGGDPASFGGVDYLAILESQYDQSTGAFEPGDFDFFSNVIAALGSIAGHGSLPPQAIAYLRSNECGGGGFSFSKACVFGPDLDTTALVVNAFVAAGLASDPVVTRAREFALTRQDADGGFTFDGFSSTSGDSTGMGLALIAALGEEAQVHPWRQTDGDDPVIRLLALQDAAGAFRFSASDDDGNILTTINAIPGMAGKTFPIRPVATPPAPSAPPGSPSPSPTPGAGTGTGAAPTGGVSTTITSPDLVKTRDRTPTFEFASNGAVRFECSLDQDVFRPCLSPFTTPRLGPRDHILAIRAVDAFGNADPTPATDGFKIKRRRKRR